MDQATPVLAVPAAIYATVRERLADADVEVVKAPRSALVGPETVRPLRPARLGAGDISSVLAGELEADLIVLDGLLDDETAARLEDAEVGYLDAGRRAWLPGWPRSRRLRQRREPARQGLAPARIRAAQLLADHPDERFTERRLAQRAAVSAPTAHHLIEILERDGIVRRRGQTRGTVRRITDVAALRRWLADRAAPHRVTTLPCYLPEIRTGETDGHLVVMSGAAAAERAGVPVLTEVPRTLLRATLAEGASLDDVPAALGGFRTTRGANALLIDDAARLGSTDPWERGEALLAPASRIMLDLYLEPRQPVDLFLDLWAERDLRAERPASHP
jgi:hypothetical protein